MIKPYIPPTKYIYPKDTFEHMLYVEPKVKAVLDGTFPYIDKTFWFRLKRGLIRFAIWLIAFPIVTIRYGVKVSGRKNIRAHKEELKQGYMSVCNHVFMWDIFVVLRAMRNKPARFPMWKTNMTAGISHLYRLAGGIPVPDCKSGLVKFSDAMDSVLINEEWMHFYPETAMFFYFGPIRPFKKGAFALAYKHRVPVIPLAISFRKRTGLYKLFSKKDPLVTINIGEPLRANYTLEKNASIEDLKNRVHLSMVQMVGFSSEEENEQAILEYEKNGQRTSGPAILYKK